MTRATEIRAGVIALKGMLRQSLENRPTIEYSFHAVTYRRGPWRWSCCPIWPLHCNDKKRRRGYAACSSSSVSVSVSQTFWDSHTVTSHERKPTKLGVIYGEQTGQHWMRLAWDSEHMDQPGWGRASGKGRERGEGARGAWREARARNPGKANNSEQSRSVPEVPDPHRLLHTGLVILSRLCDSNSARSA